jgi:predicted TIM-barrel fold metal-dependent hydrolase
MRFIPPITALALLLLVVADHASSQQSPTQPLPIIDMHIHAFGLDQMGNPPPANPRTGKETPPRTDKELMELTLSELKRYNIVKAVAGGPREDVTRWLAADPERIMGGTIFGSSGQPPDLNLLRDDIRTGRLSVLGELAPIYAGVAPNDPKMEPVWALAEELDIPVGFHTGLGPPRTPYNCCPKFRNSLGNPALLEEVLVRHPKLRVYLMHAGFPYLQETIAILHMYPQVYVDVGAIVWTRPREEFHEHLRALVRSGFGKRIMFGSDQMIWPEAIGMAIEGIESAKFLTLQQKRDIFYNNAVRFLRLDEKTLRQLSSQSSGKPKAR